MGLDILKNNWIPVRIILPFFFFQFVAILNYSICFTNTYIYHHPVEEEWRSQLLNSSVLGSPAMVFQMAVLVQLLSPLAGVLANFHFFLDLKWFQVIWMHVYQLWKVWKLRFTLGSCIMPKKKKLVECLVICLRIGWYYGKSSVENLVKFLILGEICEKHETHNSSAV